MSEEENKVPDFMVNSLDFKKVVVSNFCSMIDTFKTGNIEGISMSQDTTVKIIMNFGVIDGQVILSEESLDKLTNENFSAFIYNTLNQSANGFMATYEAKIGVDSLKPINQTGRLVIANATITPFANLQSTYKVERMLIFTDQIVGITIGVQSR